jgi:hypothetical protein
LLAVDASVNAVVDAFHLSEFEPDGPAGFLLADVRQSAA